MKQKNLLIAVVVIILVLILGYAGRHKIKNMLGMGATPAPAATTATAAPAASSTTASSNNIYLTKTDAKKGQYLSDFAGMTLYTFDKDTAGVSNCSGNCAKIWPPYTSGATAESNLPANITVIKRADGTSQFAWKGMPLYYYASDKAAGDLSGDGVGGTWHIVKP